MGGTSSSNQTTQQQQVTNPYGGAKPILDSIFARLGNINPDPTARETQALDQLGSGGGNQFADQISGVAGGLLGGGPDRTGIVQQGYDEYRASTDPFASGQYVDPSQNPALQKYLDVARGDASRGINDMFAGAGRDLSGAHAQAYGRGVGQAEAPILYDAYNRAREQQLGAIQGRYGAANTTGGILSGLDQTRFGNQIAGIGAAGAATDARNSGPLAALNAEAMRRGIPMNTLAQMMGLTMPAASGFGTTTNWGNQQGEQTKSAADTFNTWATGAGNLFKGAGQGYGYAFGGK